MIETPARAAPHDSLEMPDRPSPKAFHVERVCRGPGTETGRLAPVSKAAAPRPGRRIQAATIGTPMVQNPLLASRKSKDL